MSDSYLYGDLPDEYKELQQKLATYKIEQAKAVVKDLCNREPTERDIIRICDIRKAIEFWESSKNW